MASMKIILQRVVTGSLIALILAAIFFLLPAPYFSFVLTISTFYMLFFEWLPMSARMPLALQIFIPIYILLPYRFMITMNEDFALRPLLILLFVVVCCFDVGAYFTGTFFGKHRIAPTISPKKSWEGLLGGYLVSCLGLLIARAIFGWSGLWSTLMLIAFPLCLTAFAGDLFESWLKRKAGVKDAGALLPGHGGLFDRFDSILPTAFLIFICRHVLLKNIL